MEIYECDAQNQRLQREPTRWAVRRNGAEDAQKYTNKNKHRR